MLPEKYNLELPDILKKSNAIDRPSLLNTFYDTIVWRSPKSFTQKTKNILNEILQKRGRDPTLDVLLKLSTEIDHPWNADLLHENLKNRTLADRDYFWSIYIAYGDYDEDEYETIIRTIIDWACFGNIDEVEKERIYLCVITLMWFLTTSNRKIRDQSTKSLVRILSKYPEISLQIIELFKDVNDPYVLERLYAVLYGVVCNIDNNKIIHDISTSVFENVFADQEPVAHILLRDYAR